MAFDTLGPLLAIRNLLTGLIDPSTDAPAIQNVVLGPPTSIPARITAYVSLGNQDIPMRTSRILARDCSYYIGLVYRVDQDQQRAEQGLATIFDLFLRAIYNDRTLGGLANDVAIQDLPLTKEPRYTKVAGEEYRLGAIDLRVRQYEELTS